MSPICGRLAKSTSGPTASPVKEIGRKSKSEYRALMAPHATPASARRAVMALPGPLGPAIALVVRPRTLPPRDLFAGRCAVRPAIPVMAQTRAVGPSIAPQAGRSLGQAKIRPGGRKGGPNTQKGVWGGLGPARKKSARTADRGTQMLKGVVPPIHLAGPTPLGLRRSRGLLQD